MVQNAKAIKCNRLKKSISFDLSPFLERTSTNNFLVFLPEIFYTYTLLVNTCVCVCVCVCV